METGEAIVYVVGDEDLTKQLLMNLAINASEAFDGNGGNITFKIITAPGDEKVTLLVRDNGPGIPDRVQEKIFQPFYSTKKQGTGLGLSIVHRICSLLKLSLTVESRTGAGTTFIIEFKNFSPDKVTSVKNTLAVTTR